MRQGKSEEMREWLGKRRGGTRIGRCKNDKRRVMLIVLLISHKLMEKVA